MKPLCYYQTTSVSIPRKDDYMTIYYYRRGVMVGVKRQFEEGDFQPPKNCVEERVLDELSYNSHMKLYNEENIRLQEEFRDDLLEEYEMTNHPQATKIFNKAWDMGCSMGYREVQEYFEDLVELFRDVQENVPQYLTK